MSTQIIHTGENALIQGSPEAEYHIYVDSVNGDDSNEGFGTDDPTDAANWAKAVQTGDRARLMVPRAGRTIMHTQGDLTFNGDYFPYRGYTGELWCVSYDDMEVVATGVVNTVNASTDDIPWGEMTVTWDGGYVPTDAELRTAWANVEYDDSTINTWKILEWTDPGAGGLGIRFPKDVSADVSPGNSVTIIRPSATLTFANGNWLKNYTKLLGSSFVGYNIFNDVASLDYGCAFDDSLLPTSMAMCSIVNPIYIFSPFGHTSQVELGSFLANFFGVGQYLRGDYKLSYYAGDYLKAQYFSIGSNQLYKIDSSVIDDTDTSLLVGSRVEFLRSRNVEEGFRMHPGSSLTINDAKVANINIHDNGGGIISVYGSCGLDADSNIKGQYQGNPVALLLESGSSMNFDESEGGLIFIEGADTDLYIVVMIGCSTQFFDGRGTLDTAGAALPAYVIDGGDHYGLDFNCGAMDRGVGPLAVIKGNASVDLEKAVGTNSNAGAGYGLFVDEKAFVRADKSDCTMSGTAGEVKVGKKDPQVFPAAGTRIEDIEIGADTITAGNTFVDVAFSTQFEAGETPKVELQPLGDAGGAMWPSNITNAGFRANIAGALGVDLDFEYRARPQEPSRAMVEGY